MPLSLVSKPLARVLRVRYYSSVTTTTATTREPLKLLFCGSDDFSISSLQALHSLQKTINDPSRFASIEVVCRPGKRVGRGLKNIRQVPIKSAAEQLHLPIHEIDTFTGWTPPTKFNLIVAVSFGLFVPPRILRSAKYRGINVHPSLLPDFRGPAPLHHALLAGEKHTGVTIQTLSETDFDHGQILAQTPLPGLDIPDPDSCTPQELLKFVTPLAGDLLSKYVYNTYLKSPDRVQKADITSVNQPINLNSIRHAPKITPADREIDWESWTPKDFLRRDRVLGRLWSKIYYQDRATDQVFERRAIFEDFELLPYNFPGSDELLLNDKADGKPRILVFGKSLILVTKSDKAVLQIKSVTIEGKRPQAASQLFYLENCSISLGEGGIGIR